MGILEFVWDILLDVVGSVWPWWWVSDRLDDHSMLGAVVAVIILSGIAVAVISFAPLGWLAKGIVIAIVGVLALLAGIKLVLSHRRRDR